MRNEKNLKENDKRCNQLFEVNLRLSGTVCSKFRNICQAERDPSIRLKGKIVAEDIKYLWIDNKRCHDLLLHHLSQTGC